MPLHPVKDAETAFSNALPFLAALVARLWLDSHQDVI